jgi:hypothetical protein
MEHGLKKLVMVLLCLTAAPPGGDIRHQRNVHFGGRATEVPIKTQHRKIMNTVFGRVLGKRAVVS